MLQTRKIILLQDQSPGDILTMSRRAYDLCRTYPEWQVKIESPADELFQGNPFMADLDRKQSGVEVYRIRYDDINKSGWAGLHFAEAFGNDIEKKLNDPHIFSFSIPDSIASDTEKSIQMVKDAFQQNWSPLSPEAEISVQDSFTAKISKEGGQLAPNVKVLEIQDEDRHYDLVCKLDKEKSRLNTAFLTTIDVLYPNKLANWGKCKIESTGLNPQIYLSDEELAWYNQIHCQFYWDGPFWLLNAGRKSDNELKQYHRWQEVADILNEQWQGKVRLVQMGSQSGGGMQHIHPPIRGAFNLVGRTSIRELLRLAYWSVGIIGPISFQFVIGAATFYNQAGAVIREHIPDVVVAGGKEGMRWHVYNHVQWIKKNGCLPCTPSDGCWLGGGKGQCKTLVKPEDMEEAVPLCFEITTPEEIADAVLDHYNGMRLEMPEGEQWHVPEGGSLEDVKGKFEECYQEGRFLE